MENLRPEEENLIKDLKNLFRIKKLKKETIDTTFKYIRNLFRLEKEKIKKLSTENLEILETFLD